MTYIGGIQLIRRESWANAVTLHLATTSDILTRAKQLYDLVGGDGAGYDVCVWYMGDMQSTMWATCEEVL